MPSFLLITLAAPLASFGELAGHERRGGRERPGKSALTGLLGAALGIRRDDSQGQNALATTIDTAVRVENPGHAFQDFHTAQYVPTARIKKPQTRAKALLALGPKDNPEITRRDYRADVLYTAAYQPLADCPWTLDKMADALRTPFFTLCLGRKSCPLSLPLAPRIIEAQNMLAALECVKGERSAPARWQREHDRLDLGVLNQVIALDVHPLDAVLRSQGFGQFFSSISDRHEVDKRRLQRSADVRLTNYAASDDLPISKPCGS